MSGHSDVHHGICESRPSIDVRTWARQGGLVSGTKITQSWFGGTDLVGRLHAVIQGEQILVRREGQLCRSSGVFPRDQCLRLAWTACRYGGRRCWFRCACRRRAAKLYLDDIGNFACRHCLGLVYASQREIPRHRGLLLAQKIRKRLGGSGDIREFFPEKPKGMHWRTYLRQKHRAEAAQAAAYAQMATYLRRRDRAVDVDDRKGSQSAAGTPGARW